MKRFEEMRNGKMREREIVTKKITTTNTTREKMTKKMQRDQKREENSDGNIRP